MRRNVRLLPKVDKICFSMVGESKASMSKGRKRPNQVLGKTPEVDEEEVLVRQL